jgi:hypothetical protein
MDELKLAIPLVTFNGSIGLSVGREKKTRVPVLVFRKIEQGEPGRERSEDQIKESLKTPPSMVFEFPDIRSVDVFIKVLRRVKDEFKEQEDGQAQ